MNARDLRQILVALGVMFMLSVGLAGNLFAAGKKPAKSQDPGEQYIMRGSGQLPEVNALKVQGDIIIAGSSTVYPLAERLADTFKEEGYAGIIEISSIGSGAGFERWAVQGETDISNASRPIKDKEFAAAEKNGRKPIEFRIGTDALAVVVHKDNTWAGDVSVEELAKIFTAQKWSDVNPAWPSEDILKFSPGTDSGTFDYFVETVFDKDEKPILNAANVQLSEDDNILSRGVQGNKYAIGYFGYAYYSEQADSLKILKIEGIEANKAAVDAGTYPLARPLFMYSAASIFAEKPQVAAFLAYVLNTVNSVITDVGYFPANEDVIRAASQEWLSAVGMQ